MAQVIFKKGTQAQFDAIVNKDAGTLYFCTDTQRLFKGSVEYTKSAIVVENVPSISAGIYGKIYVCTSDGIPRVFTGSAYQAMIKPYTTSITDSDSQVPTSKAVKTYVDTKNQDNITDLSYSSNHLNVYKNGSNTVSKTVSFTGMAYSPSYDSTTRTITIPIIGGNALVINLGVDAVVSSGSYDSTTQSLILTLTSGDTVSIPVSALIDEYTVDNTSSITLTLDTAHNNKITATAKISQSANNALEIKSDGLYVPQSYSPEYSFVNTSSIELDQNEIDQVSASLKISLFQGNAASIRNDGLYVPTPTVPEYDFQDSGTVELSCSELDVVQASVKISLRSGNALTIDSGANEGLYVPSSEGSSYDFLESDTVEFDVDELNHVEASVRVSEEAGNVLTAMPDGLYVQTTGGSIEWIDISN